MTMIVRLRRRIWNVVLATVVIARRVCKTRRGNLKTAIDCHGWIFRIHPRNDSVAGGAHDVTLQAV